MIEIFKSYGAYALGTNKTIATILSGLDEATLKKEGQGHFKNILELYTHLVKTSIFLQGVVRRYWDEKYFLHKYTEKDFVLATSLAELNEALAECDAQFIEFTKIVAANDLEARRKLTRGNGEVHTVSMFDVLTQYMVHSVHHRGQLSQMLDELKCTHDIGGLWPYFAQRERNV